MSQEKTVILLELQGAQAAKALARYKVDRPQGPCLRFLIEGQPYYLKIVTTHVYLGAVIGFRRFEQDTFKHRLMLARSTFSRLGVILRNRQVPLKLRLLLWQGCVWPALLHALDCTGLPRKELMTLQTQLIKQARAISNSHSMMTKETNVDFVRRLRLQNAVNLRTRLDTHISPWLAPGPTQHQWRAVVNGHLFDGKGVWDKAEAIPTIQASSSLIPVDAVIHEKFRCDECGQEFITQASLRRHIFCSHLTEAQQQQKTVQAKVNIKQAEMAHALDGMPQCRHCRHAFSTWHAFHYHVNTRSCPALRLLYENDQTQSAVLPTLSEALISSPEVLARARNCTWQDLALMECVRAKHNHCVNSAITGAITGALPRNTFEDTWRRDTRRQWH